MKLARELGIDIEVRFIGYLDRSTELPDCYAAGDAFVFASRTETQGLVLLEAMAQGTPVVSTAELGTRSILTARLRRIRGARRRERVRRGRRAGAGTGRRTIRAAGSCARMPNPGHRRPWHAA